jgi:hypothetical protein
MTTAHNWTLLQSYDIYVDFDKELFSLPDEGNTSVDMRLTFNTESRTCYYSISLHNNDGNTRDWEKTHYVPWAVGLAMLAADGVDVPEELTK